MTSDKKNAALLAGIFAKKGLKYIIISPGSRNAPITLSFADNPAIKALSIIDERCAAFFAVGMAQQLKQTVAIACTSGTAALNFAPAIAEAYYQQVPLLVLTADRPEELIDQGDGQTIRQKNLYANYIKASFELPENFATETGLEFGIKLINMAINLTMFPNFGPVHVNLPFAEPIYNRKRLFNSGIKNIRPLERRFKLKNKKLKSFAETWNNCEKKLLIAGMMCPDYIDTKLFIRVIDDPSVVLLTETTSNLDIPGALPCIDKVVSTILPDEAEKFKPDLLVTFGGHVVSKMVKEFFRKYKPKEHWNIDPVTYKMDSYQCLTSAIRMDLNSFFGKLSERTYPVKSTFRKVWFNRDKRSERRHQAFIHGCEYSDLKVFGTILNAIPQGSHIQLGNSTPVRYAQLFRQNKNHPHFSNRGTSGIDGTVSTAAGACYVSSQLTTLITGDLGFLYDSNALMNHYLSPNLRIIIINNSGGGIFRFIDGPDKTGYLEEFFETRHSWRAEFIAKNFDIPYSCAENLVELKKHLTSFFKPGRDNKPAILEVMTPNEKNGEILRSYFRFLKSK